MEWILLGLFWVGCGILSAILATNKNRDPAAWFIIGFFFGPFGLLAAAIVEAVGEKGAASNTASTRSLLAPSRPCPYCAEDIKPEAVKCRFCGSDVEALAMRCAYCPQIVFQPKIPCSAAEPGEVRAQGSQLKSEICKRSLTEQGLLKSTSQLMTWQERIGAAFELRGVPSKDFEEWLGDLASHDALDNGDRVIKFSAKIVSEVVNGFSGAFLAADDVEKRAILKAHHFLRAPDHIRGLARQSRIS